MYFFVSELYRRDLERFGEDLSKFCQSLGHSLSSSARLALLRSTCNQKYDTTKFILRLVLTGTKILKTCFDFLFIVFVRRLVDGALRYCKIVILL